jgi:hypothetical protein
MPLLAMLAASKFRHDEITEFVMTNFSSRAVLRIRPTGANALDCPLFDFTSDPSRRPALKLHGFRKISFLDRLVNAAARPAADGKHFLESDELHAWATTRCTAFDSHIGSLLIHGCLQTKVNETSWLRQARGQAPKYSCTYKAY